MARWEEARARTLLLPGNAERGLCPKRRGVISFSFSEDHSGCRVKDGLGELCMTATEIKNGMTLGPALRKAQGELLVK